VIARSLLSPFDLHLFNEGTHSHLFNKMGAHVSHEPEGTSFAVWAPNADTVSVIGDFNGWDKNANGLFPREQSGIWEGFIPGVKHGALYKYHVQSRVTRTGADKGYFMIVPEDCCSTMNAEWHNASINFAMQNVAVVTNADAVIKAIG